RVFKFLNPVPGRLELIERGGVCAFIDYAHTPDALERAQGSIRALKPRRLITVFGCGGDRDRGKRPIMGAVATSGSDIVIVTSDNPRGEKPEGIIADIVAGIDNARGPRVETLADRREAIRRAIEISGPGDAILIAGKGHETYQEIEGCRLPFSDRDV